MFTPDDFRRPITKGKPPFEVRILRPKEYASLLNGCKRSDNRTFLQALLYTGMRYVELQRFQNNHEWFNGEFIHLPHDAVRKDKRTQMERWVRLNQPGKMIIEYFLQIDKPLPSYQSWSMNLKRWAKNAKLDTLGLSSKTTRKTWESWLMFYYPNHLPAIALSQGHTQLISLQHYINMPFNDEEGFHMKNYVEGWSPKQRGY